MWGELGTCLRDIFVSTNCLHDLDPLGLQIAYERCGVWFFSDVIQNCTGNHSHTLSAWPRSTRVVCLYNSLFLSDVRSIFVCFDTWSFDFEPHAILSHALHSPTWPTYTRRAKPRKYSWNFKFQCLEDVPRGSRGIVWYVSTLGLGLRCEYQKGAWRVLWVFHVPFNSKYLKDLYKDVFSVDFCLDGSSFVQTLLRNPDRHHTSFRDFSMQWGNWSEAIAGADMATRDSWFAKANAHSLTLILQIGNTHTHTVHRFIYRFNRIQKTCQAGHPFVSDGKITVFSSKDNVFVC